MSLLCLTIPQGQGQDLIRPIPLLHYPLNSYQASGLKICWQHSTFLWSSLFCYERAGTKVDTSGPAWCFKSSVGPKRCASSITHPMASLVGDEVLVFLYVLRRPLCRRWRGLIFVWCRSLFDIFKISPQGLPFMMISPYPFGEESFILLLYRQKTEASCNGPSPPLADIVLFGLSLSGFPLRFLKCIC